MKRRGFSLIEVLMVIAVVGLLSAIVLFAITNLQARARDAKRTSGVDQITKALDLYINQTGNPYPIATTAICLDGDDIVNTTLADANLIGQPIADPIYDSTPNCFQYITNEDGTDYTIQFFLETGSVGPKGVNVRP
jgi:prepilin-type N-terminal cleavage/methylation domain-containing protein